MEDKNKDLFFLPFKEVYGQQTGICFDLTNGCNLRCDYCFEHGKANDHMSPELARKIMRRVYRKPWKDETAFAIDKEKIFHVMFFGGEPLLNWPAMKAVFDVIEEKKMNCFTTVTSNMTLMTDEMLEYFVRHKTKFSMSIDGIKEVHDKHRCNSHDKAIKNLLKFKETGLKFDVRMTITPDCADKLLDSVKYLHEDLGCYELIPAFAFSTGEWTDETRKIARDQFFKMADYAIELSMTDNPVWIKHLDEYLFSHYKYSQFRNTPRFCRYNSGVLFISVDWNGNIYPCHDVPLYGFDEEKLEELRYGNVMTGIYPDKLYKVINESTTMEWPEKCHNCRAHNVTCLKSCQLDRKFWFNDYRQQADDFCEETLLKHDVGLYMREKIAKLDDSKIKWPHMKLIKMTIGKEKLSEYNEEERQILYQTIDNNVDLRRMILQDLDIDCDFHKFKEKLL